jgi:hypothetical protein
MRTVRKLAAVLACTTLLSVMGAATATADTKGRCDKLAQVTAKIEAKKARIAARQADRPQTQSGGQKHTANFEIKLQNKIAHLEARCSS